MTHFLLSATPKTRKAPFYKVIRFRLMLKICVLIPLLIACSSTTVKMDEFLQTKEYCDSYFSYKMCAKDFTGDNIVDAMYFEDSKDIFLYRAEKENFVKTYHSFHICAQIMDEKLTRAGSALLNINNETSLFERSELKSNIFVNYLRYAPAIAKCNREKGNSGYDSSEEEFGFDDEEYGGVY